MESARNERKGVNKTIPKTFPKVLRLSGRRIVVRRVMSHKDRSLGRSTAAHTLNGHLSNAKSSHSHRHGFYRVLELKLKAVFESRSPRGDRFCRSEILCS